MKAKLLALATPALLIVAGLSQTAGAQTTEEDIVVSGRYGRVPADAQSLSLRVSYADLDLGTAAGRDELKYRIRLTARYLCDKLGESDSADGVTPTCRDTATRDAMDRVNRIETSWAPRGAAWVRGPAWSAPYPGEWAAAHSNDGGYSGAY